MKKQTVSAFDVFVRMRRMGLTQKYLGRRHRVSSAAISQALRGKKGMGRLLSRISRSLDIIEARRIAQTSSDIRNLTGGQVPEN